MTPLMLAVATDRQNVDVIRLLLDRKADVNAGAWRERPRSTGRGRSASPSMITMLSARAP